MAEMDREELFPDRVLGYLVQWNGKTGFIVPSIPIDHALFRKAGARLKVDASDLMDEVKGVGALVSFQVYKTDTSIGAMSVTMADEAEIAILGGDEAEPLKAAAKAAGGSESWEERRAKYGKATAGSATTSAAGNAMTGKRTWTSVTKQPGLQTAPKGQAAGKPATFTRAAATVKPTTATWGKPSSASTAGGYGAGPSTWKSVAAPQPAVWSSPVAAAAAAARAHAMVSPGGPARENSGVYEKAWSAMRPQPSPMDFIAGMMMGKPRAAGGGGYARPMADYGKAGSGGATQGVMQPYGGGAPAASPYGMMQQAMMPRHQQKMQQMAAYGMDPSTGGKKRAITDMNPILMNRVHTILFNGLWRATEAVKDLEDPDGGWSQEEMVKRIARYFHKAAALPELAELSWHEGARLYIENALGGFAAACSDREWFFSFDGAPVLAEAMWELSRAMSLPPKPKWKQLEEFVVAEYAGRLDRIMLERALWEKILEVFGEKTPVHNKLYAALNKTYDTALEEALAGHISDVERVELFMKSWIHMSMDRAWQSIPDPLDTLNEAQMASLYELMVTPFGEEHPFSCVPAAIAASIGRPPSEWPLVTEAVKEVFEKWRLDLEQTAPPKKKAKKWGRKNGGMEDWQEEAGY